MGTLKKHKYTFLAVASTLAILSFGWPKLSKAPGPSQGSAKLVSVEQLPDLGSCTMDDTNGDPNYSMIASMEDTIKSRQADLFDAFKETTVLADDKLTPVDIMRPPVRTIRDSYPIYSAVAVDPIRDEVVLLDTNLFAYRIFNRTENTPAGAEFSTPKKILKGPHTHIEYNNGLTIDSRNGDVYSVAMDTEDNVIVFSHDAKDDAAPIRILKTPHRNFASALDEEKDELYVTIQYPPKVVVYSRTAEKTEKPIRALEGPNTYLHDTHGLALDFKRKLMFVGTWGNSSDPNVAGSGKFYPPSINVYPLDASGDTAPIRKIEGPKTQLDWPGGFGLDPETGLLYVSNDVAGSILVFKETDDGDVAPMHVIKGSKTLLNHPASISMDLKNHEFWQTNMGSSSASAFPLDANGNVAPIRTIRTAPAGRKSVKFGKPQAVAVDTKRGLYFIPNCVNTPQISVFPRLAGQDTPPIYALEGQKTKISRTMHAMDYDTIHDELVVGSPLSNAILTFKGTDQGEVPPVRTILGPHTQIQSVPYDGNDKMAMDPVNGEIYIPVATSNGPGKGAILVFDRLADGDVPPKRVLAGPDTGFTFPSARGTGFPYIAIDPKRNLVVVANGGALLVFDRTASGNAKPKFEIRGSSTLLGGGGYSPVRITEAGWIVGGCDRGSVCAWNINDRGDVPPRWRIPVQKLGGEPLAGQLTLDNVNKELIVPNGGRNVVMTFTWPEVFDEVAPLEARASAQ